MQFLRILNVKYLKNKEKSKQLGQRKHALHLITTKIVINKFTKINSQTKNNVEIFKSNLKFILCFCFK